MFRIACRRFVLPLLDRLSISHLITHGTHAAFTVNILLLESRGQENFLTVFGRTAQYCLGTESSDIPVFEIILV